MTEQIMDILVFKTNIRTESDKEMIKEVLSSDPRIEEWSVDCEDIDCVLRVVASDLTINELIKKIDSVGYQCAELE